jgi:uncharacterized protein
MEKMKTALKKNGQPFSLFGGEPLLVPMKDMEELFRFGLEQFGGIAKQRGLNANSIQTNGTLITPEHLDLFQKYQVGVGVSVDGPEELNDARWAGDEKSTREATKNTQWALEEMLQRKMSVSIIITLHRINAAPDRLPRLVAWVEDLAQRGLRHVNMHFLEVDGPGVRENLTLTSEENIAAVTEVSKVMARYKIDIMPLTHMRKLLRGEDGTTCTWNACDPYTTAAVSGVDGQGNMGNCGRTCKQGPHWLKADQKGFERYLSLYYTPQEYGGCQGCRFFYACKGHCPGEGMDEGDWRSKTEHCQTIMDLFTVVEAMELKAGNMPLSLSPKRQGIEDAYVRAWISGRTINLSDAVKNKPQPMSQEHVDTAHVDTPHIDHEDSVNPVVTHNDHNDNTVGGASWGSL